MKHPAVAMGALVLWLSSCAAIAAALADGNPRRDRSTHVLVAASTICEAEGPYCSHIFVVPVYRVASAPWPQFPPDSQLLAVVPGRVEQLWYAPNGTIKFVSMRLDGDYPNYDRYHDLWEMQRDGSKAHRVASGIDVPAFPDVPDGYTRDHQGHVSIQSPDGRMIASLVSGIDSYRYCISTADAADLAFERANCFGDGFYSLPAWVP